MAKVYLKQGEPFRIKWLPARVGQSGTCADPILAWFPDEGGEGVGDYEKDGLEYWVFVEKETGRFWYDNTCGI